ncbi:MAG: MBL fold metallo-hydrolase [Pseudoflavonifractor sp.]
MLELCTLASGSSGNCLLMTDGATHILVDAGISARRISSGLRELGIQPGDLTGILITHEHSDHIAGLTTLLKQLTVPVYTSRATGRQLCYRIPAMECYLHDFEPGDGFELGSMGVESFPTPHDAAGSVGYAVRCGCRKAAVVTDLGEVTQAVRDGIRGADLLVAEANYDTEMLRSGSYPYYLKQRIAGDHGHLSNEAGGALARAAVEAGAHTVVLAHLSAENNAPGVAHNAVHACLAAGGIRDGDVRLEVAPRSTTGRRYEV